MVSNRFYYNILLRIVLLLINCIFLSLVIFRLPNPSLVSLLVILIPVQAFLLIRYINAANKKIEHFFIMHLSGDVTSSFSGAEKKSEFNELYNYFRKINDKLETSRAESEIRNNYFKTIVDHTSTGLVSFTSEGRVEIFNDAAKKIFRINVLRTLEKLDMFREGLSEALMIMKPGDVQLNNLIINDELVQLSTRKAIFRTGTKELHLVSFQNIKSELEQQEVDSWHKLIRVLTHEIMNSMTPIITLVSTLSKVYQRKDSSQPKLVGEMTQQNLDKIVRGIEIIENRSKGIVHFVKNYRSVTILPKPEFQILNMRDLFLRIRDLHGAVLSERNIKVSIECPPMLHLQADGKLMEQVIINLFKNAIEALSAVPEPHIQLAAQHQNNQVVLEITDNGPGIDPYVLQHMFVPFFTTKEGGSGIGLSLSKEIIRLHGGSINLQSVPGKTVFTIRI